ncbi:MAG TPA: hypothetical protein VFB89_01260, partial [Gemmatimonadales bacterium]|nr:hypothetical protein [Gemmatimonadales bacterium]
MSSVDPEALRLIRELQANRASLSPAVGAKVDELVAKYIRPSAQMPTMPIPSPPPIERGLLDEAVGAVSQFWENINPMPQARTFAGHMQERYAQMPGTAVVSPFGHGGAAPGGTIPAIAAMGDTALD